MENALAKHEDLLDYLTQSEIRIGIGALSEAKLIKLGKSASYLCNGLPFDGEDLLHTVMVKALEGKRKCRRDLPVEVFIYGAMESLVDAFIRKRKSDPLQLTKIFSDSDEALEAIDLINKDVDTPEEVLIANQTMMKIQELFADDEKLLKILFYQMENLQPSEIQKLMQLTSVEYASALRAIRRKYEKLYI